MALTDEEIQCGKSHADTLYAVDTVYCRVEPPSDSETSGPTAEEVEEVALAPRALPTPPQRLMLPVRHHKKKKKKKKKQAHKRRPMVLKAPIIWHVFFNNQRSFRSGSLAGARSTRGCFADGCR